MISSAPPAQPDHVEKTKEVREAIFEILYMIWRIMGLGKRVQALESGNVLWTKCKFTGCCRVIHSSPLSHMTPTRRLRFLLPRQWPVSKEGTRSLESGFYVRSGGEK